jgi:ribonuclease G
LQEIAPSKQSIVKFYQSNDTPILKIQHRETDQDFIWKTVSMSKGAYLIIEHTEALHVIDVNSGNRSNKASNQKIANGGQHDCRCRNQTIAST